MKKAISLLYLVTLTIGLLGSCSKINDRLDNLEKRVDDIENKSIATIQQQMDEINVSIIKLTATDATINGQISELNATARSHQVLIDALKAADQSLGQEDEKLEALIADLEDQVAIIDGQIKTLEDADKAINIRIDSLRSYVDTELDKVGDWATETFATLDQYQQTADDLAILSVTVAGIDTTLTDVMASIADLDTKIDGLDAALQEKITSAKAELEGKITSLKTELEGKIASAISASETSIKAWINELLEGYYTAAQVDAKVTELNTSISNIKDADKARIDSLATELTTLKTAVDTAKAAIRTEYRNAIDVAINKLDGEISGALKDSILAVNGRVAALDTRVTALESRIRTIESRVRNLEEMIQSVSITPAYSDGSVEAVGGILAIKFIVRPAEALSGITSLKDSLLLYADFVKVRTRAEASAYMEIPVTAATVLDAAQGAITLRANIANYLPAETDKSLVVALNVKNGISDYTTEFYPVTLSPNVTVKDETDTTKVTIKADADFPEFTMGTIPVASGFTDSKPTTITVEGIGNITFDKEATAKIKSNAQSEGATNVFFKVEDVTTTKPVTNADVVLEVTMKTVDENGIEVFSKGKEAGEVTIEIPMDENVAYVNSVTLVNDAGEQIQGGVVPGSEKIENGKLIFKVNHFSKYAIDYVTKAEYKAVTSVSIELASVTLQVDDTLRLVANIAPEDATNKKVTWSSSDTTKVKVDDTGKITAVAFGKATITVTTIDGNKTADCTVKVSETKTMADILKTTTGIPESQNLTPPANAWVNSTDPDCKAFVGKDGEAKLFVILKEGQPSASLKLRMDDAFARIDDNTYQRIDPSVGTFTIKMAEGKFTSYEFAAVSGSAYEQFNGTYSVPVSKEYVEIAAKYDGSTVSTLRWYRQSLAITDSGKKAWKGGSGSAVKVPGTGEDVVVGDYFQWGTFTGFYGNGDGTDKGLLPYTSFTSTGCGDGSDAFTFKSGKQFNEENAPYRSGSAYTKYNAEDGKTTLDASDDVASIILGGTWRMPTSAEIVAMKAATYWKWDATDKGYYVFIPMEGDAGKINDETSNTYDKADALLFFPAVGMGFEDTLDSSTYYWSRTLSSNSVCAYTMYIDESEIHPDEDEATVRSLGFAIRPVQDPAATYVAVTNVSLDVTAKEIEAGGNVQLEVTVAPATATQNGVYWTSSAPTVATVDATGKVTAVAAGTATITATTVDGSKTATCTVTVTAPVTTFKAVYNTNGDANTLTFYFDANDHSGEGITVYESTGLLSTETINNPNNWGYHDKRGEIKSVVIDTSVAGYKGLTSTAYMFTNMKNANNISGAEYLDVSNVTDMKGMFYYFGSSLQNFNSVPDVSGWKTGSVTNMTSMFSCYGNNSTVLADVPDVSSWNTVKVTDMSNMFMSYGYHSKQLNAVPKVGGWNTAEVENMTAMFYCFADSSTVLAVVPDVSNWNTGNVKKMGDMFNDYGRKSTVLNTVPDVSKWNTGNVTTVINMFQNYGYSSTGLSTVPNVSNWKTGNVTKIKNLFKDYGHTSNNIDCTLNLSGWDLSKITGTSDADDVFNFTPKTFDVTIPATTGAKSNEGGKWYYGNGTNYIAPPAGKTFTPLLPPAGVSGNGTEQYTNNSNPNWF